MRPLRNPEHEGAYSIAKGTTLFCLSHGRRGIALLPRLKLLAQVFDGKGNLSLLIVPGSATTSADLAVDLDEQDPSV